MPTVVAFDRYAPFEPETANAMGLAFDTAWQALLVSSSPLVSPDYADQTREQLALHIIDAAKVGQRDVNGLREIALQSVLNGERKRA